MKRLLFFVVLAALCTTAMADGHFLTDKAYRDKVARTFSNRMSQVGGKFFAPGKSGVTREETEALKFLYAYMPLADVTDYTTDFFLSNVRASFAARREMAWGQSVPELLFRHFVLPIRVNNEPLDSSRVVFYRELKQRVKGLNMYDAILEVNHWCHERVTYQPSDARTSASLATVRTATGRCGEQSTFAVAALRAVGIPARQVYTPRWAHTDDNHAWVEAWADGKWYFLGACEPEPVLNLGWFNSPASRGMLMHTKVFGDYDGPEEVMLRATNFTEINLIGNYAPYSKVGVKVVNADGTAAADARVDFKLYNYAEFCTVATKYADSKGCTDISAGNGDMMVWASRNGRFGFRKVTFGKDREVTVCLDRSMSDAVALYDTLDVVPPKENPTLPYVSKEQRERNNVRFAYEDSIRKAYTATFPTMESANAVCAEAAEYIVKSRGNHRVIIDFIRRHADNMPRVLALFKTLSDKDFRDITPDILEDNFSAASDQVGPRVENEMLIAPFKNLLAEHFAAHRNEFVANPQALVDWMKANVRVSTDSLALKIAQTPVGVLKAGLTDTRSRDIFFVDVARSLGIEARKDAVTSKVQYRQNGEWHDVVFGASATKGNAPQGRLVLTYNPTKLLDNPKYYSHFTLSRIVNGVTRLLNFEEGQADMGEGSTWGNTFRDGLALDAGKYLLTTGTRLADGSVLATNRLFDIKAGETVTVPLEMRTSQTAVSVIGSFNSESMFQKDGKEVSILSQTGRGYFVIGLVGVGQEPTNHALHDIEKMRQELESWGRPMLLLFANEADAQKFSHSEFANLPSTVMFGIDADGSIRRQIAKEMKLHNPEQMPIFFIADTFNRVVFLSQGYTIGLGEQLHKVVHGL
ncbi:MAG: transglutaminase-like domain-containing protein [Prevotellaceae bacterium]|nr:transglutaminase-like domain-containing protein [Prevotellaceae bacterium]